MTAVPADAPVTTPDEETVATPVLLLAHVPPPVASLSSVLKPWQAEAVPVIGDGNAVTVSVRVT